MRKTWLLDCELDYDVLQQTVFVFHISVPDDSNQRVIEESTSVFPDATNDEFRDPSGMNRFVRVDAPPGPLTLRYLAAVEVESPAYDQERATSADREACPPTRFPICAPAGIANRTSCSRSRATCSVICRRTSCASRRFANGFAPTSIIGSAPPRRQRPPRTCFRARLVSAVTSRTWPSRSAGL
jgi:hypothetical protein